MQLIGMLDSPYVRRVAVALIAAKIPFEHRPISLFRHIDEFSIINPLVKAPTLVTDDGTVLIDSTLIVDYLLATYPAMTALTPKNPAERPHVLRFAGLALAVMEKAVQRHYERALRPAEKLHQPWVDRIMGQLHAGLQALDRELPQTGWIAGALGLADIAVVCAFGFVAGTVGDVVDVASYANLADFSARAEALPAFRAAPSKDGVTAKMAVASLS
jgi:glutathione S-transferase